MGIGARTRRTVTGEHITPDMSEDTAPPPTLVERYRGLSLLGAKHEQHEQKVPSLTEQLYGCAVSLDEAGFTPIYPNAKDVQLEALRGGSILYFFIHDADRAFNLPAIQVKMLTPASSEAADTCILDIYAGERSDLSMNISGRPEKIRAYLEIYLVRLALARSPANRQIELL